MRSSRIFLKRRKTRTADLIIASLHGKGGGLSQDAPSPTLPCFQPQRIAMKPVRDVVAAIGRTPLIKLRAASEATGCTILGKAEFMNPGGSVKDRAALAMIGD